MKAKAEKGHGEHDGFVFRVQRREILPERFLITEINAEREMSSFSSIMKDSRSWAGIGGIQGDLWRVQIRTHSPASGQGIRAQGRGLKVLSCFH